MMIASSVTSSIAHVCSTISMPCQARLSLLDACFAQNVFSHEVLQRNHNIQHVRIPDTCVKQPSQSLPFHILHTLWWLRKYCFHLLYQNVHIVVSWDKIYCIGFKTLPCHLTFELSVLSAPSVASLLDVGWLVSPVFSFYFYSVMVSSQIR